MKNTDILSLARHLYSQLDDEQQSQADLVTMVITQVIHIMENLSVHHHH